MDAELDNTIENRILHSINNKKKTAQEIAEEGDVYDYIAEVPNTEDFKKKYKYYKSHTPIMSQVEYARYLQFCKDHKHEEVEHGTIGGGLFVSYMATGLGYLWKCDCEICGGSVDITDIETW
jgi:hypothetical protein